MSDPKLMNAWEWLLQVLVGKTIEDVNVDSIGGVALTLSGGIEVAFCADTDGDDRPVQVYLERCSKDAEEGTNADA